MEKCLCCGRETSHTATVYVKTPGCSPQSRTEFLCPDCVKKQSSGFSGVIFYLALQLCWLNVIKSGLTSPFGILAACIALVGLWRLAVLVLRRFSRGAAGSCGEEEASGALKALLLKQESCPGSQVLDLREYRRTYG